jgi:flagellar basal body-associated protein FliL
MGGDDAVMREASNTTLWVLLGLVGFIFVATGATAFFLWRKAINAPTTSNA